MSRHEGVSCDSCLKGNFRGRRFKCLICYDYDLCAPCYESGATTARHTTDHPMQCILTRTDFDLFYGGEALSADQPQAFTCPYCSRAGLTEGGLLDHVTAEHADSSAEVVCPICAAMPSGDPNYVTDDFAAHLTLEHRAPRELEEPIGSIRHVRRIPHPGRGVGSRQRRANMHFPSSGTASLGGLAAANSRDTMDPIAELLSQLSSVRSRAAAAQSVSSQLQQLEMQLQTTRYGVDSRLRQQLERIPRRPGIETSRPSVTANGNQAPVAMLDFAGAVASSAPGASNNNNGSSAGPASTTSCSAANSQFLLARLGDVELSESERRALDSARADRSVFVQELLLSSLSEGLRLSSDDDSDDSDDGELFVVAAAAASAPDRPTSRCEDNPRPPSDRPARPNGPPNDVILHASRGGAAVTNGDTGETTVSKRGSKESTPSDRSSKGIRSSNSPPPKNTH